MIAAWMLYCSALGLLLVGAGLALERALQLVSRPSRWVWVATLVGTFGLPAFALVKPEAFTPIAVPVAEAPSLPAESRAASLAPVHGSLVAAPGFSIADLDRPLGIIWGMASTLMVLMGGLAVARLWWLKRSWRTMSLEGRTVLVSQDVGPAVAGMPGGRIVVPEWALGLDARLQRLMLLHESEHLAAGDPWLLAGAALALVAMPWNVALWWQVRRLRLAIEMDCDARVLRSAPDASAYGELLLSVGRRLSAPMPLTPTLTEPMSLLARRIRRMTERRPRGYAARAIGLIGAAGVALAVSCQTPRPVGLDRDNHVAIDTTIGDVIDSAIAMHMRPQIQQALARYYPVLLNETSGPPVDVWFGHDGRGHVQLSASRAGTGAGIDADQIQSVFPTFRPGNDGWSVVDRRALRGLVRDNVRVIWVNLQASGNSAAVTGPGIATTAYDTAFDHLREHVRRAVGDVVRQYTGQAVNLWFVVTAQGEVIRQGTGPGAADHSISSSEASAAVPGFDTLRIQSYSVLGHGALGPGSPPILWIKLGDRNAPRAREEAHLLAHAGLSAVDHQPEMVTLPWIREALPRYFADVLRQAEGPPLELWVVADRQKQVLRTARVATPPRRIGIEQIKALFPDLSELQVNGWMVTNRGVAPGIGALRKNVNVVWVQLR